MHSTAAGTGEHAASLLSDSLRMITDGEFRQLRELIHLHTGIALSEHKRALVCARLSRRLRHYQFTRYAQYYELLCQGDPDGVELMEMINAITTNKTDFFREAHHFQFLAEQVFPRLRQGKARRLRLWSAATATGEEAYSLAMTVREAFVDAPDWDIKILATDIDTRVLSHAREGIYTAEQATHVEPALLHRYFLKGHGELENRVRVKPALKTLLRFRQLNLLDEPWPMRAPFDVIFCRNVLIYFDKATQCRLLERMSTMLSPDGFLMLGHAEAVHGFDSLYRAAGHSIYQTRVGRCA
ncbi:MAG TPA: protein-glutamate O-methyltransferase [Acidiferrobacterales bacterium]|nr:protein-glutamate O-methyltransferase [Acidiferrobacterales bacterium]